ncbi:MAG TPA: TlpA disulfide reductase family protein, partial [Cryomorphaceae bacterium]|nr:TlpA disulfide reductase family protein [Cryomorphaceae bacterium]
SDLDEKYVVLFFYDPDCGHCKKETPKLVEFYKGFDKDLLAIYAVSSDDLDKRKEFIEKYELDSIYNVGIPQRAFDDADFATRLITTGKSNLKSLKYQETFDVYSTPKVIILDENRKIRAKDIGVDKIGELIERFETMDTEKKVDKSEQQ